MTCRLINNAFEEGRQGVAHDENVPRVVRRSDISRLAPDISNVLLFQLITAGSVSGAPSRDVVRREDPFFSVVMRYSTSRSCADRKVLFRILAESKVKVVGDCMHVLACGVYAGGLLHIRIYGT